MHHGGSSYNFTKRTKKSTNEKDKQLVVYDISTKTYLELSFLTKLHGSYDLYTFNFLCG